MYTNETQEIFEKLSIFNKMYETIRYVDPVMKKVGNLQDNTFEELSMKCFEFWGREKICDNCISMRAYNENETFVKIEYTKDKIFMLTAIPYELYNRRIVIELMKNITNSIVFGAEGENNSDKSEVYKMIDSMNNMALKDALTGVYNRRYINEKLPIDFISSTLQDQNISVIIADIDFFKKVNDTYGHLAGDYVLKSFAQTLSDCLQRESDWVARFGGEEFLICMPGADTLTAVEIAEAMRKLVEQKEMSYGENIIKITASFGVCSIVPSQGDTAESLLQKADEKLYLAKESGRNRVEY